MTRQTLEAEFGGPGVENPQIVDLITLDPVSGHVVLVMVERRPWGASPRQFQQIEEKINRYLAYALDGFLVEHYPQYRSKDIELRLDCVEEAHGDAINFIAAAQRAAQAHGIPLVVRVVPPTS